MQTDRGPRFFVKRTFLRMVEPKPSRYLDTAQDVVTTHHPPVIKTHLPTSVIITRKKLFAGSGGYPTCRSTKQCVGPYDRGGCVPGDNTGRRCFGSLQACQFLLCESSRVSQPWSYWRQEKPGVAYSGEGYHYNRYLDYLQICGWSFYNGSYVQRPNLGS